MDLKQKIDLVDGGGKPSPGGLVRQPPPLPPSISLSQKPLIETPTTAPEVSKLKIAPDPILRKRVNFKLANNKIMDAPPPNNLLVKFNNPRKFHPNKLIPYKVSREMKIKNVVYNGTYPIDDPISSRFEEEEIYAQDDCEDVYEDQDDYEVDDDDDDDGGGGGGDDGSWTMKELIQDKNIGFNNYSKMKNDFEKSFKEFERILERKSGRSEVKSFDIDEPL